MQEDTVDYNIKLVALIVYGLECEQKCMANIWFVLLAPEASEASDIYGPSYKLITGA